MPRIRSGTAHFIQLSASLQLGELNATQFHHEFKLCAAGSATCEVDTLRLYANSSTFSVDDDAVQEIVARMRADARAMKGLYGKCIALVTFSSSITSSNHGKGGSCDFWHQLQHLVNSKAAERRLQTFGVEPLRQLTEQLSGPADVALSAKASESAVTESSVEVTDESLTFF